MFWLSLIAGSLVFHLVVLLVGRWYLSQKTSLPAGNAQAPLEFVEIDPNAPLPKQAKSIAPASNATAPLPKAPPPQAEPVTPEQTQPSIENLTRQTAPDRTRSAVQASQRPTPSPSNPVTPAEPKPQTEKRPTEPSNPSRPPENPTRPTNSGSSNPAQTSPGGSSSSGSTAPPGSSNPSPPTTPETTPGTTPGTSTNSPESNSSETQPSELPTPGGTTSGTSLPSEATFQGKIARTLERDPNERQRDGARSITVKNETIPPLSIMFPSKLPVQVLDLKVLVVMDRDGKVFSSIVQDDSPAFQANPDLKESDIRQNVQATVDQLFLSTDDLFEVTPEGKTTPDQLFSRIAQIQIKVAQ